MDTVSNIKKSKKTIKCCICGIYACDSCASFHTFPKNEEMSEKWAAASGKKWVNQASVCVRWAKFRVCSEHFQPQDYLSTVGRKLLKPTAVPMTTNLDNSLVNVCRLSSDLQRKLDSSSAEQDISNIDMSDNIDVSPFMLTSTPKSNRSTRVITPKTRKIKLLSTKLYYLRKKYSNISRGVTQKEKIICILKNVKPLVTPIVYNFIASQLKNSSLSPYGRRWTVADKNLALQIYLASPKAYTSLSKFLNLPTKKTLSNCLAGIEMSPGFSTAVLNAIKLVASKLKSHDKYCIVSFDEIKLKSGLSYNSKNDRIDGYENYGFYCNQTPKLATHGLVFMVRGLCKKWKQAFGHFLSCETTPSSVLKLLVNDCIIKLYNSGLTPVAIVCDQGANNQRLYATELQVSKDVPYFFVNNHKVYATHDVPHLLKCLRNNFKRYPVKFSDDKVAYWEHIEKVWEFDSEMPHRIAPKLTKRHVTVDGLSSMSVKLAVQVLSQSVATALSYLTKFHVLPVYANNTAEFCSTVNNLFDSLNSRVFKHPTRELLSAVTKTTPHIEYWEKFKLFIQSIEFKTQGKKITFPCLQGWMITLTAFKELVPNLLNDIPYILMSRFTQDALEIFFSQVRRKGGNNDHPTPSDFLHRVKLLMAQNIISTCGTANCEPDNDTVLVPVEVLTAASKFCGNIDDPIDDILAETGENDDIEYPSGQHDIFAQNSAAYVAGFVAKHALKKNSCDLCKYLLLGDKVLTDSTVFLIFKEFDIVREGLHAPSDSLLFTVCEFGRRFPILYNKFCFKPGVKCNIVNCLYEVEHDWLCATHGQELWTYILNFYVKLMLFYKVRFISRDIKNKKKSAKKLLKMQK